MNKKLTDEQLREFHDAFSAFDKKHKGYIGNRDVKLLMRSLGFNPTELEVDNLCMKIDVDGNGKVDFHEFINLMIELENPEVDQQSYIEAFRSFDNTNKGYIHSSLIKEILLEVMAKRSHKDKQQIVKVFRLDQDRRVDGYLLRWWQRRFCFDSKTTTTPKLIIVVSLSVGGEGSNFFAEVDCEKNQQIISSIYSNASQPASFYLADA
eukprot:gene20357-22365_t